MPFYRYECENCGFEIEAFQRREDPALRDCPQCSALLSCSSKDAEDDGAEGARPSMPGKDNGTIPWSPVETEIHRGWKKRRKWKRDAIAQWKRERRSRDKG